MCCDTRMLNSFSLRLGVQTDVMNLHLIRIHLHSLGVMFFSFGLGVISWYQDMRPLPFAGLCVPEVIDGEAAIRLCRCCSNPLTSERLLLPTMRVLPHWLVHGPWVHLPVSYILCCRYCYIGKGICCVFVCVLEYTLWRLERNHLVPPLFFFQC